MTSCDGCDYAEVMPDGSLFCALHDEMVHEYGSCVSWTGPSSAFMPVDLEDISIAEEDY